MVTFENNSIFGRENLIEIFSDPLQCDICKEWFKNRDTIRAHMSYVHVQGPQPCSVCGKVSANRKALRKHMTIHLESWKDRFKCIICGRGFRDNTKLKVCLNHTFHFINICIIMVAYRWILIFRNTLTYIAVLQMRMNVIFVVKTFVLALHYRHIV